MPGTMSIGGIVSGLKTDDIIAKIMEYARKPQEKLQSNVTLAQSKLAAWQDLNTRVLALKLKSDSIATGSVFKAKGVTSSDPAILTASASSDALEGTYYVKVTSRAQSHQLASSQTYTSMTDTVGTGKVTISLGEYTKDVSGESRFVEKHDHFDVELNANNNTLAGMRDAINRENKGVKAVVVNEGTTESPAYRLLLTSTKTGAEYAMQVDTSGLSGGAAPTVNREVQAATNAVLELGQGADNIKVTKTTNSINELIPGVTLNIASVNPDKTVKIDVSKNTNTVQSSIDGFVTQYNDMMDVIGSQFTYDSDTGDTGTLFGSYQLQMVQSSLTSAISNPILGVDSKYNTLSSVGVTLNASGRLVVDDGRLSEALNADPDAVAKLFSANVEADSSYITYLSHTSDTVPSVAGGYAVVVTQAARRAQVTAELAMDPGGLGTTILGADETIVVNGTNIDLKAGMKLSDVVDEINKKSTVTGVAALATGSDGTGTGGYLTLRNVRYGSNHDITIKSLTSNGGAGTTGIGTKEISGADPIGQSGGGIGMVGLDVQGTINGEAAKGEGQVLTGISEDKNAKAKGLALMITSQGPMTSDVHYTKGFGAIMRDLVVGMTGKNGIFTQTQESLNSEIDATNQNIVDMETRILAQQDRLYAQFSAMETQLAKLQDQGNYLTSMLSGSSKSS